MLAFFMPEYPRKQSAIYFSQIILGFFLIHHAAPQRARHGHHHHQQSHAPAEIAIPIEACRRRP